MSVTDNIEKLIGRGKPWKDRSDEEKRAACDALDKATDYHLNELAADITEYIHSYGVPLKLMIYGVIVPDPSWSAKQ